MDSRSIFLHRYSVLNQRGHGMVLVAGRWRCSVPGRVIGRGEGEALPNPSAGSHGRQEKPSEELVTARTADRHRWATGTPVRWTSDPPLRNSANWSRTFGRRDPVLAQAGGGRREPAQATV